MLEQVQAEIRNVVIASGNLEVADRFRWDEDIECYVIDHGDFTEILPRDVSLWGT